MVTPLDWAPRRCIWSSFYRAAAGLTWSLSTSPSQPLCGLDDPSLEVVDDLAKPWLLGRVGLQHRAPGTGFSKLGKCLIWSVRSLELEALFVAGEHSILESVEDAAQCPLRRRPAGLARKLARGDRVRTAERVEERQCRAEALQHRWNAGHPLACLIGHWPALTQALGGLRRFLGGQKAVLLWEGLPAHRSKAMRAWLRRQRHWLVVEPLPAYAPDLNPVEMSLPQCEFCRASLA
jgi:hypothetical protein